MSDITVLLGAWDKWRSFYTPEKATAMARMLRHYVRLPLNIVLLTDMCRQADDIDRVYPETPDIEDLGHVKGPDCFRRLRYFDPDYNGQFGTSWVVSIDLDTVILDDVTDLFEHAVGQAFGFCILRSKFAAQPGARPFNGGLWFLQAGRHANVWQDFDPYHSRKRMEATGWHGSDQVWISMCLPEAPVVGIEQGIYYHEQYRDRAADDPHPRIVTYAGFIKPWSKPGRTASPELWEHWHRFADARPAAAGAQS